MFNWSEEQKKVIAARGSDILVSAAAGSGKTAVLVERILRRITEDGVSLEELIVMTFTRAAAAEMRERIEKALRERLEKDPQNQAVRLQLAILPRARISTIDSICQGLIRQYYQYLEIDPGFRVADEGELKVIRADLLEELLTEKYEEADPDFMRLADTFSKRGNDQSISALIAKLYDFSQSQVFPESYLKAQLEESSREAEGEYLGSLWFREALDDIHTTVREYQELFTYAVNLCNEPDGPAKYLSDIEACDPAAESILAADSYEELYRAVTAISFGKLSTIRKTDPCDPVKKELVKSVRNEFKDYVTKTLKSNYLILPPELFRQTVMGGALVNRTFLKLTLEFLGRFEQKKRESNIVDFSDMEHLALKLLYVDRDGVPVPSETADSIAQQLKEIMIDEYQDSNAVQEALLNALSAERFGRPDVFMVGDVKQSIYRFRQADPHIFIEKYNRYRVPGSGTLIELNSNYRSRTEVVDSVNAVFGRIMRREIGGVEYDNAARLKPKASYPENRKFLEDGTEVTACTTEILIADSTEDAAAAQGSAAGAGSAANAESVAGIGSAAGKSSGAGAGSAAGAGAEEQEELKAEELEYRMIAGRIRELLSSRDPEKRFRVTDKKLGTLRPVRPGDITVLMRAAKGHAEKLVEILTRNGIPARYDNSSGYFTADEVEKVMAFLDIIDNPHQDIPLTTVLRSPMFGFSDDELSLIHAEYRDYLSSIPIEAAGASGMLFTGGPEAEGGPEEEDDPEEQFAPAGRAASFNEKRKPDFWDAVQYCAAGNEKLRGFLEKLREYRELSAVLPVHELLGRIYTDTGYYHYVSAMPGGSSRVKNLDMLLERSENYGSTGLHGLFNFARYVEALKKNDFDYGEAGPDTDNEDCVCVRTIHSSKGLEYPVVFLARTAAKTRNSDKEEGIVIDEALGVGADYLDPESNIRYPGLKKMIIRQKNKKEDLGESLRLLYVAMTRAKEKLIITGTRSSKKDADAKDQVRDLGISGDLLAAASSSGDKLPVRRITEFSKFLDWILLAAGTDRDALDIRVLDREEILKESPAEIRENEEIFSRLEEIRSGKAPVSETGTRFEKELLKIFEAQYAHLEETLLKPKISVSEIKHAEIEHLQEQKKAEADYDDISPLADQAALEFEDPSARKLPSGAFTAQGRAGTAVPEGARRGTAFHRAMELYPYLDSFEEDLAEIRSCGRMLPAELDILDVPALRVFASSGLHDRMKAAFHEGRLRREQHFMAGIPAKELISAQESDEFQILQGIIDAYIEEADGSITLIDYKTDRNVSDEELKALYRVQLELYSRALEQLTGKTVGQRIIYSTFLKKELML